MRYRNIIRGIFLDRPNRFIAHAEIEGRRETVHVKNTGRCRELLLPGAEVWLTAPGTESRKTKYDLVAVKKNNGLLINIDSQAPNAVVKEWLEKQDFDRIKPEYTYGDSRIDFYLERGTERILMEVKGCTLEVDGIGYFPDAPTERGVKHLGELAKAVQDGYRAVIAFAIQMDGITEVRPNIQTHPEFGDAMREAREAGVEVLFLPCHVEPDGLNVINNIRMNRV
ncbi:MAG: DNA/RNA nuclease SfsA [Clostridia bacterium]|nr:DNA/RNA nuclease SfsA [Clostridia bacterium]